MVNRAAIGTISSKKNQGQNQGNASRTALNQGSHAPRMLAAGRGLSAVLCYTGTASR